jgi:hypothetical protein
MLKDQSRGSLGGSMTMMAHRVRSKSSTHCDGAMRGGGIKLRRASCVACREIALGNHLP